jgi:hypothetical protein
MHTVSKHRDIAGRDLAIDHHVILCEHNRIILGRVIKLHDNWQSQVTVEPLRSTAGGRRVEPSLKPLRRSSYNLYLVTDQEILMAMLRGAV